MRATGSTSTDTRQHWSTRQLATMAILIALGFLISFIEIPLIPGFEFLRYDPSSVAMLLGTFMFGPLSGALIGSLIALVHGSPDGIVGIGMNVVAMVAMGVPAGLVYLRSKTRRNAVVALAVGSASMVAVNLLANIVITPIYLGIPRAAVVAMVLPALLPFNVAKAVLNSVITFLVYKTVSRVAKSEHGVPLLDSDDSDVV